MEIAIVSTRGRPPMRPSGSEEAAEASKYPESSPNSSPSDPEVLRRLYANMLTCRMVREKIRAMSEQGGELGNLRDTQGGEAIEVGATFELRPEDALSLHHLDMVGHILKGRSLSQIFARLTGERKDRSLPQEADPFLASNIIPAGSSSAAQLNVAAGVAFSYKQLGQRNVVLAIFGDGFDSLGSWHDAAKLAGQHRLPLIFVVENDRRRHENGNHWFGEPGDLSDRARQYGFPGIPVDGDDVVAVFRVTQESIHRARNGAGPTLIECKTSRISGRSDSEAATNHKRLRAPKTVDPLFHMEHYLKKRKAWSAAWKAGIVQRLSREIAEASEETKPIAKR